jgi:hypothetical protein
MGRRSGVAGWVGRGGGGYSNDVVECSPRAVHTGEGRVARFNQSGVGCVGCSV